MRKGATLELPPVSPLAFMPGLPLTCDTMIVTGSRVILKSIMSLAGLRVVEASAVCFDVCISSTLRYLVRWSRPSPVCWINSGGQWCLRDTH
jgi:hypothetical protein